MKAGAGQWWLDVGAGVIDEGFEEAVREKGPRTK